MPRFVALLLLLSVALAGDGMLAPADPHAGHQRTAAAGPSLHEQILQSQELSTAHAGSVNPNPLEIDPDLVLFTAALFGLLLVVMSKFAWGPIMAGLKKREDGVAGDLAAAEARHQEAQALLAEYQQRLERAGDDVRATMDAAKKEAETMKQSILDEAQKAAAAEKDRATAEIGAAKDTAIRELSGHSINWAFRVASDALKRDVKPGDHQELIDSK